MSSYNRAICLASSVNIRALDCCKRAAWTRHHSGLQERVLQWEEYFPQSTLCLFGDSWRFVESTNCLHGKIMLFKSLISFIFIFKLAHMELDICVAHFWANVFVSVFFQSSALPPSFFPPLQQYPFCFSVMRPFVKLCPLP